MFEHGIERGAGASFPVASDTPRRLWTTWIWHAQGLFPLFHMQVVSPLLGRRPRPRRPRSGAGAGYSKTGLPWAGILTDQPMQGSSRFAIYLE